MNPNGTLYNPSKLEIWARRHDKEISIHVDVARNTDILTNRLDDLWRSYENVVVYPDYNVQNYFFAIQDEMISMCVAGYQKFADGYTRSENRKYEVDHIPLDLYRIACTVLRPNDHHITVRERLKWLYNILYKFRNEWVGNRWREH